MASYNEVANGQRRFTLTVTGATLGIIVVLFIVLDLHILSLAQSVERLARRVEQIERHIAMAGTLHDDFVSGGVTYNVDTTIQEGESKTHWKRRHIDALVAAWELHEPD